MNLAILIDIQHKRKTKYEHYKEHIRWESINIDLILAF